MPKVVVEYKDQARDRLVDAALAVFHSKGFRSATMEDIAKQIGVSKGAIYLYFPTKTALLAQVQQRSRERIVAAWRRLIESGDVAEGIARSIDEVLSGEADPGVWHELVAEAATDPEIRQALRTDHDEDLVAMTDFLRRLEARGRVRKLRDPTTAAGIVLGLLHAAVLDYMLRGRREESRELLVRELRYLLEKGR